MYGLKHSLILVWKTDNDAILSETAAGAGKVSLDEISWFVPHVIPADAEKFSIYKTNESKVKLPVALRTRQCDVISSRIDKFHKATERKKSSAETKMYYCLIPNG